MSWRLVGLAVAIAVALAAVLALPGRDAGGPDLKQELADLSRDLRGRVEPLPKVRDAAPPAYRAGTLPDPFYPAEKK